MTARLFARTSAANHGHTAEALFLPELRRHVEVNLPPMPIVEYIDRDLSHRGPRPRLVALTADLVAGDVVVLVNFAHAGKSLHHLAELLHAWLDRGARVISLEDAIDSGTEAHAGMLRHLVSLSLTTQRAITKEAHQVGAVRARASNEGAPIRRPSAVINSVELKKLYEEGKNGRALGAEDMAKALSIGGVKLSRTVVRAALERLREAGKLDDEKRRQLLAVSKVNGRRQRPLIYDPNEIGQLLGKGLGLRLIAKNARSLPKDRSLHYVGRIVADWKSKHGSELVGIGRPSEGG